MLFLTSEWSRKRRWAATAVALVLAGSAACSLLLDDNALQCRVDSDCDKFGGVHPQCVNGACQPSGLGPPGCFFGTPADQNEAEFLNQCSPSGATCAMFSDCDQLGLCGDAEPPMLVPPPAPEGGADAGALEGGGSMPKCGDMASPGGVVYITGSSNFPTVLSKMAPVILAGAPPLEPGPTPVFLQTSSCTAAKDAFTSQLIHDPISPGDNTAMYFMADGGSAKCSLGGSEHVDVGEADVFATTCGYTPGGATPLDEVGPIQAMVFAVPYTSPEMAISREAAREVFGLGGNQGLAKPWTIPGYYFVRSATTGTQQMIAKEIGVDAGSFWGVDKKSAANVLASLIGLNGSVFDRNGIGILSADVYDSDRASVRALAYQETAQTCAYLPDSSQTSFDKQNVRDGHYPIWGPLHFFDVPGTSAPADLFVDYWKVLDLNAPVIDALVASSLIPVCAMTVKRVDDTELAGLAVATSTDGPSCGCYFDAAVVKQFGGTPRTDCIACDPETNPCPSDRPKCNLKYCEVR